MNLFEKIVKQASKDGIQFKGVDYCIAQKCNNVAEWEQEITHNTEGKINMNLCEKHMKAFNDDKSFNIEIVRGVKN